MSYTPFNAPLLSPLLGDMEIAGQFSIKADIECMLRFEAALASAQVGAGLISAEAASKITKACSDFEPDMGKLQKGVERDGMAVPEFVTQLRKACGEASEFLHFGSTSQDVIDTSLVLRLKRVNGILRERLATVIELLEILDQKFGHREMMAYTRMQAALPITVGHRISQWINPLSRHFTAFDAIEAELHVVQLGGPVGDLQKMGKKGADVRKRLAEELQLGDPGASWHTDRSRLIGYCNWLTQTSAGLGKIGQDFALMAQDAAREISFKDAGGSSAMAHKQNPIKAEVLISQARFAAVLASGMDQAAIHEQERSGSAWALEWMILPQIAVVAGASLNNTISLLGSITDMGKP